ncbi:uncharacterized protein [Haliotis asinina]|uniref:uncharacterized protein n=1 Tax=Haliotis asinina TaxID=109174 RepID=UPI0035320CC2
MPGVAKVCIPALLVFHLVEDIVCGDCTGGEVNGCTANLPLGLYKKSFTSSCNRHDVCYMCGSKFGKSRSWCDWRFLQNMLSTCSTWDILCHGHAHCYFIAVLVFGAFFYHDSPVTWCDDSWIEPCI